MRSYAMKPQRRGPGGIARLIDDGPSSAKGQLAADATQQLTTLIAHACQSYDGAARLLTFRGGPPLPWSAMVLARTVFESAMRVIYMLEPLIEDELRLARFAAHIIENINEAAKANDGLPDGLAAKSRKEVADYRHRLEGLCTESGMSCVGNRSGKVATGESGSAAYPLNLSDAAKRWWDPHGLFTYRWLSSFTHGSPRLGEAAGLPVAAIAAQDAFATFAVVTEALWVAMDSYARWLGFPDGLVMTLMRRVKRTCSAYFPAGLPTRPPGEGEEYFVAAAEAMRELGVSARVATRFLRGFTRTIDR